MYFFPSFESMAVPFAKKKSVGSVMVPWRVISLLYIYIYIWSNYSDLTRPHPKWWFSKGIPLISGKSRLVKYYTVKHCVTLCYSPFVWIYPTIGSSFQTSDETSGCYSKIYDRTRELGQIFDCTKPCARASIPSFSNPYHPFGW